MRSFNASALPFLFAACFVCCAATVGAAQAPEVVKVEPPNWWAGHSINPVRVLIRGKNFAGARVESSSGGLRPSNTKINATDTYIFVDVLIDSRAQPGMRSLKITTAHGTV